MGKGIRTDGHAIRSMTLEEAFWFLTDARGPDECWPWLGSTVEDGYGRVMKNRVTHKAHRLSYEIHNGPIPANLVIDHLCHGWDEGCDLDQDCPHRRCVNPAHLEAVPDRVNILRGRGFAGNAARKTHCPANHPLAGENLLDSASGFRICRTCKRDKERERRARGRTPAPHA